MTLSAAALTEPEEARRLDFLRGLGILDTPREARLDAITQAAARYFEMPIALVTLIDSDRQLIKSSVGFDQTETSRASSFCHFTIQSNRLLIVEDTHLNPDFENSPLVRNAPHVRFYAGAPLIIANAFRIGGFCLLDKAPRRLSDACQQHLWNFALVASQVIEDIYLNPLAPEYQPTPPGEMKRL